MVAVTTSHKASGGKKSQNKAQKADVTLGASKSLAPTASKLGEKAESRIDAALLEKAVTALLQHHEVTSNKKDLLGNEAVVQVQLGLEVAPKYGQPKPMRLAIPHPFRKTADSDEDLEEPEVCLIVKEESKPWVQEMIQRFPEHMSCIKKVLGLQSLRTKHAQFQQQRELLHRYNCFMADDRILPMLSKALGKEFFKTKKQPIPIRLTRKEALPFAIQRALSATFMTLSRGTCITIAAGKTSMDAKALVENITTLIPQAVAKVPRQWSNIRSISIKCPASMALPFFVQTPEQLIELAKVAGLKPVWKDPDPMEEDMDSEERKRKLAEKSPLVKAIKKQKGGGDEEAPKAHKKSEKVVAKAEMKYESKSKQLKQATDEKGRYENINRRKEGKPVSSAEGTKTQVHKERKDMNEQKPDKRKPSAKDASTRNQETETDNRQTTSISRDSLPDKTFVAAKMYKGSKDGFVFKMGDSGLGYYQDFKPVVDKMALEALTRAATSKKSRRKTGTVDSKGSERKKRRERR